MARRDCVLALVFCAALAAVTLLPAPSMGFAFGGDACPVLKNDAGEVKASEITEDLEEGKKVVHDGVRVIIDRTGEEDKHINLQSTISVSSPLVVINSVIESRLVAPFTVFGGPVDFSGSCFREDVDVRGSVFEGDVRFTSTRLEGSLAADGARFNRSFDMSDSRATGKVTFKNAVFVEDASAQSRIFEEQAVFTNATFQRNARFSRAVFRQGVMFDGAFVAGDATLTWARFFGDSFFTGFEAAGQLDLLRAIVDCPLKLDSVSAKSLRLEQIEFDRSAAPACIGAEGVLHMGDLNAAALEMDLATVKKIEGNGAQRRHQILALRLIEVTARADGRTEDANDAAFRRQELETERRAQPWKILWYTGGELVAGYLVRPLHPLIWMFGFVAVGTMARTFAISPKPGKSVRASWYWRTRSKRYRISRSVLRFFAPIVSAALAAIAVAVKPQPPKLTLGPLDEESCGRLCGASGRWFEWGAQKILNGFFVIGLANAFPGAKEIFETVL